jgi:hypothetical protein
MARPSARSFVLLAGIITAACGSSAIPGPGATPPRESGQSRLIEKTVAGKNRCNAQDHTRPFVVEWDGTDISSFESRATTDVVFVRYEGCNLQVLDGCTNDAVRGSLGAYGAVDWTSGSVEKVDILNEDELYAKLPLGAAVIGARVQGGERFHMEYFVSGTRKATRPAVYRSELDRVPGCRGATHYVYAYNVGAFALGSFSKLEGSAGATIWGAGGGGNHKDQSAIEKQGGVLASCRGESATEVSTCKVPIRLTLREVEPGDNPDAKAAVAPETPDALNLAGKLAASNERTQKASEHLGSAHRKLTAGDGKGCLADLDTYDRLDARPGTSSTDPKGNGWLRAFCLMLSGQCDAGRALARRSGQARAPSTEAASRIDDSVDSSVAQYCGEGAKTPRDRLLVGLATLREGAQRSRLSGKACASAVDSASAALPKVTPRDSEDRLVKGAGRAIAEDGTRCLARAGDCVTAWKKYPALLAGWGKSESVEWGTAPEKVRSMFESSSYGECVGKESGPLSPTEELARSVEELKWAEGHSTTTVTTALCNVLIERGSRALQSLKDDKSDWVKYSRGYMRTEGAKCLTKAGDCAASRSHFITGFLAEHPAETNLRAEDAYASDQWGGACNAKLVSGLPPKEAVANALRVIDHARRTDRSCAESFEALKKSVAAAHDPDLQEKLEHELWRRPLYCFDSAGQCDEAWRAFQVTNTWRKKPEDLRTMRKTFTTFATKCADATIAGLSPAEQYWQAHDQLAYAKPAKVTKETCLALYQVAKRTAPAASSTAAKDVEDLDLTLAHCLGRGAGDCTGAQQALARTSRAGNASDLRSFCPAK